MVKLRENFIDSEKASADGRCRGCEGQPGVRFGHSISSQFCPAIGARRQCGCYQGKSGHSADIACLYRMTLSPHRALCNFAASAAISLASTANPSAADQTFVQAALRHSPEEAPPQDVALRDRGPCRPILNGKTTDRRD